MVVGIDKNFHGRSLSFAYNRNTYRSKPYRKWCVKFILKTAHKAILKKSLGGLIVKGQHTVCT